MIERFYDLDFDGGDGGDILLDGMPITQIPIGVLRNQVALVGQEPVLFARSIADNIKLGARFGETPSMDDVIDAAKRANAFDFISELPHGFDTMLGERSATQLSGGQKQVRSMHEIECRL